MILLLMEEFNMNKLITQEKSNKYYKILTHPLFMLMQTIMGIFCFIENAYILSFIFFGIIISICLILTEDLLVIFLPILLVSMSVLKMYGATVSDFLPLIPLAIIIVICIILHFILFKRKIIIGKQIKMLLGVSVALFIGGLGVITLREHFTIINMYYVLGLGFILTFFYLILRSYIICDDNHNPCEVITNIMLFVGLMGVIMILSVAVPSIIEGVYNYNVQWKNNLGTFMLFTLPFPFYKSIKSKYSYLWILYGLLLFIGTVLTLSRGAVIFGSVLFVLCIIYSFFYVNRYNRIFIATIVSITIVMIILLLVFNEGLRNAFFGRMDIDPNESRIKMYIHAIQSFLEHPLFGVGMGYQGLEELYSPQKGAMHWYHSTPFQVIASMGLVGVVAYAHQFYIRMEIVLKKRNSFNFCILLSFLGIQLMSLVNPGEFCPMPFALLLLTIITICEISNASKEQEINKYRILVV